MSFSKFKSILVMLALLITIAPTLRADDPDEKPDQFSEETLRTVYELMDVEFLKISSDPNTVPLHDLNTNAPSRGMADLAASDLDELVKGSAGEMNVPYVIVYRPTNDLMAWTSPEYQNRTFSDLKMFRMRTLHQAEAQLAEFRNEASQDGQLKDQGTTRGEKGHLYVGGTQFGTEFPHAVESLYARPEVTILWRWGNWVIQFQVKDSWFETLTDEEKRLWAQGQHGAVTESDRMRQKYADHLKQLLGSIERIAQRFESLARRAEEALGLRPTLRLDRESVPRGANIRVIGIGFEFGGHATIYLDGKEFFTITETGRGGSFDDWIWIPDNIEPGVHEIWAESGAKRDPSNKIKLEVFEMRHAQLIENLDKVIDLYQDAMPKNPRWAQGWANNMVDAGKTAAMYIPSAVYSMGTGEQVKLEFHESAYVCSSYQATALEFLNNLKWSKDPRVRTMMDGLDYGPFISGLLDVKAFCHYYVIVWPHGAALAPLEKKATFAAEPTWSNCGLAFDPWPYQRPAVIQLKEDSGQWAKTSAYSTEWTMVFDNFYTGARPEAKWYFVGKYPVTGGDYYYNPHRTKDARSISIPAWGLGEEAPQSLSVRSPVRLEIRDAQGRTTGALGDGRQVAEISNSAVVSIPKPASEGTGQTWFAVLPDGQFEVKIIATADGEFELLTKQRAKSVQGYPRVKIKKGDVATITLNNANDRPNPLKTADGKEWMPKETLTAAMDPEKHREAESSPIVIGAPSDTDDLKGGKGEILWVPIVLHGSSGVANANIEIEYDSTMLKVEGTIRRGDALGPNAIIQSNTKSAGKIRLAFANSTEIKPGAVFLVPFRALANAGTKATLTLRVASAHDAEGKSGDVSVDNISVMIVESGEARPN